MPFSKEQDVSVEEIASLLRYDPETGSLTWLPRDGRTTVGRRFNGQYAGREASAPHTKGYRQVGVSTTAGKRKYLAHRVAYALYWRRWPSGQIDHLNNDRSDNRIVNLREATAAENNRNRKATPARSGLKGAYKKSHGGGYFSQITVGGKLTWLGSYKTQEEAAAAYDVAAAKLHGQFAKTNIDMGLL